MKENDHNTLLQQTACSYHPKNPGFPTPGALNGFYNAVPFTKCSFDSHSCQDPEQNTTHPWKIRTTTPKGTESSFTLPPKLSLMSFCVSPARFDPPAQNPAKQPFGLTESKQR
jgi:hypothetical protein